MSPSEPGVRISQKQIYEMLIEVDRKVSALPETRRTVEDHEERIRALEKIVWKSSALTGLISAVLTSVITAVIVQSL